MSDSAFGACGVGIDYPFSAAVSFCRNRGLRNGNGKAYDTVLSVAYAAFGTGRGSSCVDDLGVTLCGNGCLRCGDGITNGAVLTFGKTRLGAGRSLRRVNNLCVSFCGDSVCFY